MAPIRWFFMVLAAYFWSAAAVPANAAEPDFAPFLGTFSGRSVSHIGAGAELSSRDLNVEIKAAKKGKGFSVAWTTVIHKIGGKTKNTRFTIAFRPTKRVGIYSGGTQKNVFGAMVPADPVRGTPYFWARIRGNLLEVFGLHINDAGTYEIQVYKRTVTKEGMTIVFERLRDGKALKTITGVLKKVK